ncbi:MAG: hypothetical protein ING12_01010 [Roseomonas sp.]|nr:hypothetical protein [Roseomonas sp.]
MDASSARLLNPIDDEELWALSATSYLDGTPVLLLHRDILSDPCAVKLKSLPDNFEDFCRVQSRDVARYRRAIDRMQAKHFGCHWLNAPPFLRLLRTHWYWRWYEISQILKCVNELDDKMACKITFFSPLILHYSVRSVEGGRFLVFGPEIGWQGISDTRSTATAVEKFQRIISSYWSKDLTQSNERHPATQYPAELLLRYSYYRPIRNVMGVSRVGQNFHLFEEAMNAARSLKGRTEINEIMYLCALLSVRVSLKNFGIEGDRSKRINENIKAIFLEKSPKSRLSLNDIDVSDGVSTDDLVVHRLEAGIMAWNQYFQESLSIFRAWLSSSSYLIISPWMPDGADRTNLNWNRLGRFLCSSFHASEATIYRYRIAEEDAHLYAIGSYCSGPNGDEKSQFKREFMRNAARTREEREKSVSYRAADQNRLEYVPDALSDDASALKPISSPWDDWGRSILAIPIRLNGCVWGIIEIVSTHPNHFKSMARIKCEEICSILSTNFLVSNIFESIARMERFWTDDFGVERGRKSELCCELSKIFLCDSLSIFMSSQSDQGQHFNVMEFASWSSNNQAEVGGRKSPHEFIENNAVRDFLDSGAQIRELVFSQEEYTKDVSYGANRRTFLVLLSPSGVMGWAGVLAFSVPYPIASDANWEKTTFALGQLVGGVLANLTSGISWARDARHVLRHEYRRITEALSGVANRLDQSIIRHLAADDRRVGDLVLGDLRDAQMSLVRISDALLVDVYDRRLHEDPRLIPVQRAKETFRPDDVRGISLRDQFYKNFWSAGNAQKAKKLNFTHDILDKEKIIKMDALSLSDILATLADNAVKYSITGSEIRMSLSDAVGGGVKMRISNLAPALEGRERTKIFEDGFRGAYAREGLPGRGAGRGLGFAKKAMEIWNGTLSHRQEAPSVHIAPIDGRRIVWHRFTLTFPGSLVFDKISSQSDSRSILRGGSE